MKRTYPRILMAVLIMAGFQLAACSDTRPKHTMIQPAHVETIEGTDLHRVTLTAKAMERLNVKTAEVRDGTKDLNAGSAVFSGSGSGSDRPKVVPYASLIYDAHGDTWVYTSLEKGTFVRHQVIVDHIEGDNAYVLEGPPVGTMVATEGVAEIYGTEFEVGH